MVNENCPKCGHPISKQGRPAAISEADLKIELRAHIAVADIAKKYGCSRSAIYNAIKRLKAKRRPT